MNPNFSKALFRDIDIVNLDYQKYKRFVIERVLTRGNWNDCQELKTSYGMTEIQNEVINMRYLDKKTQNF